MNVNNIFVGISSNEIMAYHNKMSLNNKSMPPNSQWNTIAYWNNIFIIAVKNENSIIGNYDDLISINYPIFCNDGNNRIFTYELNNHKKFKIDNYIYNFQYEDECSFYANGVMVNSLSPNHKYCKMSSRIFKESTITFTSSFTF